MATINKNLSIYDPESVPNGADFRIGIVVAEWNHNVTGNLLEGAKKTLIDNGVKDENIHITWVPGSFELPLGAQFLLENDTVDAVICLGCVIQGETKHFDFVCHGTTQGVMDLNLKYNKPVIFGLLTDNTLQQSLDRSGGKHGNKGIECAVTALKMVGLKKTLGIKCI